MTRYPKILIEVKDENGNQVYMRTSSYFDTAASMLNDAEEEWLTYLDETNELVEKELQAEKENE